MNIQLTLAARYLSGRKLRSFLTTLAIVFGVLVIFGMNTLLPAMLQAFQVNIMAAADQVDATITLKTSDAFPTSVATQVTNIEGVRAVSGSLERTVNVSTDYYDQDPATPDTISAITLVGIDPQQARTIHAYLIKMGRFLEPNETKAAVISQSLADAIGLKLGDVLPLPAAEGEIDLTIIGLLPARAMPGNEEVIVTLDQAQQILGMPGKINTIEVNFTSLDETARLATEQAILDRLGDTYQIGSLASNSEMLNNLFIVQAIFNLLGILALMMGGFIILNTFRTIVAERRHDIGMLRALGANRRTVLGIILSEGLVQGIVGTAAGLLLGYLLGLGLINIMNPMLQHYMNTKLSTPVVSPTLVIGSIAMGVGVTLLAGLLPALSASKVTPLEALRPTIEKITMKRMAGFSFWTGVVMIGLAAAALFTQEVGLIGLGAILFIIGLILVTPAMINPLANLFSSILALIFARSGTAQLAEGNLSRQPSRAAITASTTLIGMAILVMAAAFITSASIGFRRVLEKSLGSDFLLIPPSVALWGSNIGAGSELADTMGSLNGIGTVSTMRFAPTQINETAVSVMGIDPVAYPQVSGLNFSEGDEIAAFAALAEGRKAIINGVLALNIGATLGDDIELITPHGRQTYQVVAIASDFLNAKIASAYISHASIAADFDRKDDILLQIDLADGADKAAVEADLKKLVKSYPQFRLINGQEYLDENMKLFNTAFAGLLALVIFLSVPSLIAMVNTLVIGIIERTREIGMLRAVGATRRQVRTVVLVEAIILAALGTAFGVLVGLYLGYTAINAIALAGFPMEFAFPGTGVLIAISAGIISGVLAAIVPARQAARLEIVQALRFE